MALKRSKSSRYTLKKKTITRGGKRVKTHVRVLKKSAK